MSTRSATIFMRRESGEHGECTSEELLRFYRHCDGYPEGHGWEMAEAFAKAAEKRELDSRLWVQDCLAELFASQNRMEVEPKGWQHHDIEYLYVVGGPYSVRDGWGLVERHGVEVAVYDACIDGWLKDKEWSYDRVLEHEPLFSGTPEDYIAWARGL